MRAVRIFLFYFSRFRVNTSPHFFEELRYTQSLVLRKSVDNLGIKCSEPRVVLGALPAQRVLLLSFRAIVLQMTRAELAAEGVEAGHRLSAIGHQSSGIGQNEKNQKAVFGLSTILTPSVEWNRTADFSSLITPRRCFICLR